MSRQLHFGTTYQVQYGYGGMFGSDGQDALYDIFSMFEIENNADDIYTDDYEVEREELKRLRQILIDKDEKYRENEEELTRYLTKIEMTLEECGSTEIQTQAWVDANTHEYIGETGIDRDDNWCNECEAHNYFCTKTEFVERMEAWWGDADFPTMERVTGYRQDDFSPEEGYQDFVDACNEWWKAKSYDEKRAIFKENNSEE